MNEWGTFSANLYNPYWEGKQAEEKYLSQPVKEYLIFGPEKFGYRCNSIKLPNLVKLYRYLDSLNVVFDLYIRHKNFKWTYVITHVDAFGPYFAE